MGAFCSGARHSASGSQKMTPWESPGKGKAYKELFAAHLNVLQHAARHQARDGGFLLAIHS